MDTEKIASKMESSGLQLGDSEPIKAFFYPKLNALINLPLFYFQFEALSQITKEKP